MSHELRPYQKSGAEFLVLHGRAALAFDPGTGKTPTTLEALRLLGDPRGRTLILCPKTAVGVWVSHFDSWLGIKAVHTDTSEKARKALLVKENLYSSEHVVVVTFSRIDDLVKAGFIHWNTIVVDEAQYARNHQTLLFKALRKFRSERLFLLSGNFARRGAQDLWTYLCLLEPQTYRSYWDFVSEYCFIEEAPFGKMVYGTRKGALLRQILSKYFLRARKDKVLPELPEKQRIWVNVEQTPRQYLLYEEMRDRMGVDLGETISLAPTVLTQILRLRQILITPALLGGPDESGMLDAFGALVEVEADLGNPIVVFSPFVEAFPFIQKRLKDAGFEKTIIISGGMSGPEITDRVKQFQTGGDTKRALLCSIQSGTAFTATAASVCFFIGFDWSPDVNTQCENRLHRIGQDNFVRAYYFSTLGTVDQHVRDVLNEKISWNSLTLESLTKPLRAELTD